MSPMSWVEENRAKTVPASFAQASNIDIDDPIECAKVSQEPVAATIPTTIKRKAEPFTSNNAVKILNISAPSKPTVKKPPTPTQIVKLEAENYTIRRVSMAPIVISTPIITKKEAATPLPQFDALDVSDLQFAPPEPEPVQTIQPAPQEDLKPFLINSLQQIAELKQIIQERKAEETLPPIKKDFSSISQSHLNKVQLFNGIKRYLSPSMNALLRIELFSNPNRDYKKDEKIICQELFELGEKTYDFLTDEWRLRLPAKNEVVKWMEDHETEEDNDAC